MQYTEEQLEKMRKTLREAKANPDDPKSKEIFKRIEEGKMNYELKALGLEQVKVERPKADLKPFLTETLTKDIQTKKIQEKPKESAFMRTVKDIPSDVRETADNLREKGTEISQNLIDVYRDDEITVANKFLATLGAGAATVVGGLDEAVMGTGKLFMTDEAEKRLGEIVKERVAGTNLEKSIKDLMEWHAGLDKNTQTTLNSIIPMAELMSEFIVLDKVAAPIREGISEGIEVTADAAKKLPAVGERVEQGIESGVRKLGEGLDEASQASKAERIAEQQARVDEAVSRITQAGADKDTIEAAKRTLSELDTTNVKTYEDLNKSIRDKRATLSKSQDNYLSQFPEKFTPQQTGKYTDVSGKTVIENPVTDAMDGLETAYRKSGEASKAEEIVQLRERFNTEGLTVKELNDLARRYAVEFKDRSFNRNGDPKAGYNAEAFEATRKGIKDVVRERLPDEESKLLDEKISDTYDVLRATEKIENGVAKLHQRISDRTLAQKIGRQLGNLADFATFGSLRGFIASVMPSNIGNKAMNSIEIEKELTKNLAEINELLEIQDSTTFAEKFSEWYKNINPGLGIRDVSPEIKKIEDQMKRLDEAGKSKSQSYKDLEKARDELYKKEASFKEGEIPSTKTEGVDYEGDTPIVYHVTLNENVEGIKKEGVLAQESMSGPEGAYVFLNRKDAENFLDEMYEEGTAEIVDIPTTQKAVDDLIENPFGVDDGESARRSLTDIPYVKKKGEIPQTTPEDSLLNDWVTRDVAEFSKDFTPEEIAELDKVFSKYPKPNKPITLYRAGDQSSDRLTSWTSNPEVAEMHAEVRRDAGLSDGIVTKEIQPDQILVSLTDLPPDLKKKYKVIEDEEEFILKPFK